MKQEFKKVVLQEEWCKWPKGHVNSLPTRTADKLIERGVAVAADKRGRPKTNKVEAPKNRAIKTG